MEKTLKALRQLQRTRVREGQPARCYFSGGNARAAANLELVQDAGEQRVTHFPLADGIFAAASVAPTHRVSLWLGVRPWAVRAWLPGWAGLNPLPRVQANVMLEYELDEAETLLAKQVDGIKGLIAVADESLDFLKTQITTSQVRWGRAGRQPGGCGALRRCVLGPRAAAVDTQVNFSRIYNWGVQQRRQRQGPAAVSASSGVP
jgi:hypothetical protein